jgi:hypothetical protein
MVYPLAVERGEGVIVACDGVEAIASHQRDATIMTEPCIAEVTWGASGHGGVSASER